MSKISMFFMKCMLMVVLVTMELAGLAALPSPVMAAAPTLGCTPAEGNLCIKVNINGSIYIQRYTAGGWQAQVSGTAASPAKGSFLRGSYTIDGTTNTATYGLGFYTGSSTAIVPASNTLNGNSITTVLSNGMSNYIVTQVVTYAGTGSVVDYSWTIHNGTTVERTDLRFYHGSDNFLAGSENGGGYWKPAANAVGVANTTTVGGVTTTRAQELIAITTADLAGYGSAVNSTVKSNVETANALSSTVAPISTTNNAYALEWRLPSLGTNKDWNISAQENFSATAPDQTLTVSIAGTNNGIVTSTPAGINCAGATGTCSAAFPMTSSVALTAASVTGADFSDWTGDVASTANPVVVNMDVNRSETANYTPNNYALTVSKVGNGTVTVNPATGPYHYNQTVTLTATADLGWTFAGWSGGATGATSPKDVIIQGDTMVTATFTRNVYTVNVAKVGSGTVSVSPATGPFYYNDTVTLTATADPGWTFAGWSGDVTGTTSPKNITIQGNVAATATFTRDEYTMSVTKVGNGMVTVTPATGPYYYNDTVTLVVTADPGWTFTGWSGDVVDTTASVDVVIKGDTAVTATFTQDEYTLTVTKAGNGTVTVDPETGPYYYDDEITLIATADPGWTFTGWSGDVVDTAASVEIVIKSNTSATATFTRDEYTLDVTKVGNGTVTVDPAAGPYYYNDTVTLTASADSYWTFAGWSGDVVDTAASVDVVIKGNTAVTATFTQDEYTLAVTKVGNGTVTVDPATGPYYYNDTITLTATGDPGWTFAGWSGDVVDTDASVEIAIKGNTAVTATFSHDEYTLDVTKVGNGTVTADPAVGPYYYNDLVTLTATAGPGWTFAGWSGDIVDTAASVDVVIRGNVAVTATFTRDEYTLVVTKIGKGTVTVDPETGPYYYNDTVTLMATADPDWTFAGWSGDVVSTENPLIITIKGNTAVTATFMQDEFSLTLSQEGSGAVTANPATGPYYENDEVVLTADAADGWTFTGWSGDVVSTDNPLTITIQGNTAVKADFTQDKYALTLTQEGSGLVTANPATGPYVYNDEVILTADAADGWTFTGWSGDVVSTDNPLTVKMTGNTAVKATFTQDAYSLTLTKVGDGTVTADPATGPYIYNDQVVLSANADPGWTFTGWSNGETANPLTISIKGSTAIEATFTQDGYTLTITKSGTGKGVVTVDPVKEKYHYGEKVTLTATAETGSHFSQWSGDTTGTISLVEVILKGNITIDAKFTLDEYALTITKSGTGSGNVVVFPVKPTYAYGDTVTLTAMTNAGSHFTGWSGGATGATSPVTITFSGNTTVDAAFVMDEYTLTVTRSGMGAGSVAVAPVKSTYHYGDKVTLTATPNSTSHFTGWSGGAAGTTNPVEVTINANTTVNAAFAKFAADLAAGMTTEKTPSGLRFTLTITNRGPDAADGATVMDAFDSQLSEAAWICTAETGAVCANASGTGDLNEVITILPSGGKVTFIVTARVTSWVNLANQVRVIAPSSVDDPESANNAANYQMISFFLPWITR